MSDNAPVPDSSSQQRELWRRYWWVVLLLIICALLLCVLVGPGRAILSPQPGPGPVVTTEAPAPTETQAATDTATPTATATATQAVTETQVVTETQEVPTVTNTPGVCVCRDGTLYCPAQQPVANSKRCPQPPPQVTCGCDPTTNIYTCSDGSTPPPPAGVSCGGPTTCPPGSTEPQCQPPTSNRDCGQPCSPNVVVDPNSGWFCDNGTWNNVICGKTHPKCNPYTSCCGPYCG